MECDYIEEFKNIGVYDYYLLYSYESIFIYLQADDIGVHWLFEDWFTRR